MTKTIRTALAVGVSAMLLACGGGGSSGPGAGGTANGNGTGLSENQALFEDMALASNGGMYTVPAQTIPSFSSLNADRNELPSSPSGVPGGVTAVYVSSALTSTPIAPQYDSRDENIGTRFVDNGQLRYFPAKTPPRYTYVGADVLSDISADTGEIGASRRLTGHAKVALTGKFTEAQKEFLDFYGPVLARAKAGATFLPGAAYYRQTGRRVGDHLFVNDGDGQASTDPKSATPLFVGTLDAYVQSRIANGPELPAGSFKTLKGVRCRISNSAATNTSDSAGYEGYCEIGQKVYGALLVPDGAEIGSFYVSAGNSLTRAPFTMRLNKAAVDSMRAALP